MAISRVDTTITSTATSASSITPAAPVGVTAGDLIIVVASLSKASTTWAATSYAGWTMLETGLVDGSLITQILYRVATGSGDAPPTMNLTATQTAGMIATAAAYRGVDNTTPFIASGQQVQGTNSTSHPAPALTNTDAAAWAVYAAHARQVATPLTWSPPAGMTEQEDADNGVANTNNVAATWCDSNGTVATGSVTYSGTTSVTTATCVSFAAFLKPGGPTAVSAALSGSGTLTAGATVAVARAAALGGTGTLTTSQTPAIPTAAALGGTGTLTAVTAPSVARAAALGGSGTLTATSTPAVARTAALGGSGTLTASTFGSVVAAISGSGTLTAAQVIALARAAALGGSGTLTTAQAMTVVRAAALSGSGSLTAGAKPGFVRAAALSGVGTLTARALFRLAWWTGTVWARLASKVWTGSSWDDVLVTVTDD